MKQPAEQQQSWGETCTASMQRAVPAAVFNVWDHMDPEEEDRRRVDA